MSKLDQSRLFLRDFSYCAYRCTMPFHHHWQERDFAAEVVIFFFCKGKQLSKKTKLYLLVEVKIMSFSFVNKLILVYEFMAAYLAILLIFTIKSFNLTLNCTPNYVYLLADVGRVCGSCID